MLKLTRVTGESVKVYDAKGNELTIIVLGADRRQVRLGFHDPARHFEVIREECIEEEEDQ